MINTIYLVKKNPNIPNSSDNWIEMSIDEYNAFVKTPAAQGRYFADIGGHEDNTTWYVVECPRETALAWRRELNRHYYLKRKEQESGIQTISMSSLIINDEEYNGEEIIPDSDVDVVAEVMQKITFERLEYALNLLSDWEYEIVYLLYLTDKPISERNLAKKLGLPQKTLNNRKLQILSRIKIFLEN